MEIKGVTAESLCDQETPGTSAVACSCGGELQWTCAKPGVKNVF